MADWMPTRRRRSSRARRCPKSVRYVRPWAGLPPIARRTASGVRALSSSAKWCAMARLMRSQLVPAKRVFRPREATLAKTLRRNFCLLELGECADVLDGAAAERGELVTAFERRDDPPFRMPVGDPHELAGDPRVIAFGELQVGERVVAMRVEPGRHEDDLGPMRFERRQAD